MVLKEIIGLVSRYPHLLTSNVIHKISSLEDGASSATRSHIHELRNEYNTRSREHLMTNPDLTTGITVVKVTEKEQPMSYGTAHYTSHLFSNLRLGEAPRATCFRTSCHRSTFTSSSSPSPVTPGH